MDMLSNNNWKRPLFFSTTVPSAQYKGLEKYFIQEGLAYRVAPVRTGNPIPGEFGMIDHASMYENLMNRFKWGNAENPDVYLDENNRRMFSNFRRLFGSLSIRLAVLGDTARAIEVARRGLEIVPEDKIPYDYFIVEIAEALIRTGNSAEGLSLIDRITAYAEEYLAYAVSLKPADRYGLEYPIGINIQTLIEIYRMAERLGLDELSGRIEPDLNRYYSVLYSSASE